MPIRLCHAIRWVAVLSMFCGALLAGPARAATYTVSTLDDSGAGSLRQAIIDANAAASDDAIEFSVNGTITLSSALPNIANNGKLSITGNGIANTVIHANNAYRGFTVPSGANLSLSDLTVTNGYDSGGTGGGIYNGGTLTLTRCKLANSSAATAGGGLFAQGTTTLVNSLFTGNTTSGNGGGLYATGGALTVTHSSFVQNTSTNAGGGLALVNVPSATLRNTLIADNTSTNSSDDDLTNSGSTLNARNSLIETGSSGITGTNVNNLAADPVLDASFVPQLGSPAINAGDSSLVPVDLTTDLAGSTRIQHGVVDIGAYESSYSNLVVFNTNDSGTGSLRQAITNANSDGIDSLITFTASANGTITLASPLPGIANNGTLTITGNGTANTIVNGADTYRHFDVASGANLTLDGLTLEHGRQAGGGAIYSNGTVTINNAYLHHNVSSPTGNSGGAILAYGDVTISNSTLSNNSAVSGGGVIRHITGALTIRNSLFENNAAGIGGAVMAQGDSVTISNASFSGNTSNGSGAGLYTSSNGHIANSTFSGNIAGGNGGGVSNSSAGVLTLVNSTLSGNSAINGGAVFNDNTGTINIYNSILANSLAGGDCYQNGTVINARNSLIEDGLSCVNGTSSDNLVMDPALNADLSLSAASYAINYASTALAKDSGGAALTVDHDGAARSQMGAVDMGAFESSYSAPLHVVQVSAQDATGAEQGSDPITFRISRNYAFNTPLTVAYTLGGTASAADYNALSGSATIAANSDYVDVVVTPVNDALAEGSETVSLSLAANAAYTLGATTSASGTIADNDFVLSLATAGSGSGTLGGSTAGTYSAGAAITLSATPNSGSSFAGWSAGCSASFSMPASNLSCTATFTDTGAPDTSLISVPPAVNSSSSATFTFSGTDNIGVTGFECSLDSGAYTACTSPKTYSGLADGSHNVRVRAKDAAGNVDASPASHTWTVDTTAPDTTLSSTPANPSGTSVSFAFSGSDSVAVGSYECRLDSGSYASCTSPKTYSGLADGSHTFNVRAVDTAGNVDATPASFTWSVVSSATVTLTVASTSVAEGAGTDFTLSRSGPTASELAVALNLTAGAGTATTDYLLSGAGISGQSGSVTATLPAGSTSATIHFDALDDPAAGAEASNTLTLAVTSGGYTIGSPASATVTIPANGLVVVNTHDSGEGSLRQAITNANAFASNDAITFTTGANGTITLASALPNIANNGSLSISGNGTANTIISGNHASRVFYVNTGANLSLSGLAMVDGTAPAGDMLGGAIRNEGTLTVTNCLLSGNTASGNGGAIANFGTLSVATSSFDNNQTNLSGGGISNTSTGTLTVSATTFSNNTATGAYSMPGGGGIANAGGATVTNSLFTANTGTVGGNLHNEGTLTITNSRISGGVATLVGGGVSSSSGTLTVNNSTLSDNTAPTNNGSGLWNNGTTHLNNSVIAGSGVNCLRGGGTIHASHSLIEDGLNCVNGSNTNNLSGDPLLDAGFAPTPGSPLVDAGDDSLIPGGLTTDLAGNARIQGNRVDIGAFESALVPLVSLSAVATTLGEGDTTTITVTRSSGLVADQTVSLSIAGGGGLSTADYSLSGGSISGQSGNVSVTLPAGSASVDLSLAIVNDALQESSETMTLTLVEGAAYDLGSGSPRVFTLTDNDYLLSLATAGTGSGSLGGSAAGVYDAGATITLSATPDAGSTFAGWSAGCSASFAMPASDLACTATFTLQNHTVTPSAGANGSLSPPTAQSVSHGGNTSFTVTPNTGFGIGTVSGCGGTLAGNTYTTGAITADCTVSASFTDTTAPDTSLISTPPALDASGSATFSFSGTDNMGTPGFECSLDGGAYVTCSSPKTYSGLADGAHTLAVRAKDAAGNVDPSPASYTWTVDTTAPDTSLTSTPADPSGSDVSFGFTGSDTNGVDAYQCRLDGGAYLACTSPQAYTGLADGPHTFDVRAMDLAGNVDPTPASHAWSVLTSTTVTLGVAAASVAEGGSTDFTISRTGPTTDALTVNLVLTPGSGTQTTDYLLSGGGISGQSGNVTVTIPAGSVSVAVGFAALDDPAAGAEADNGLTLALAAGGYTVGSPASATATIPANGLTVVNTQDSGEGSLRQAITNANAWASDDTITFDAAANGTLTLASPLPELAANGSLTITGNGLDDTVISGNNAFQVFAIAAGATVWLTDLTVTQGRSASYGGGIFNAGTLAFSRGRVSASTAGSGHAGGGIANTGSLTVRDVLFTGNVAPSGGGAISNRDGGIVTVIHSLFSGNTANFGGALNNGWSSTITLTGSTLSGNRADNGSGGGNLFSVGDIHLGNTVVAGSLNGGDCVRNGGTIHAENSLIEGGLGCVNGSSHHNLTGDPGLNPDFTPAAGSPVVNAGDDGLIPVGISTDLAGAARIQGGRVDMGAYESSWLPQVHLSPASVSVEEGGSTTLTLARSSDPGADLTVNLAVTPGSGVDTGDYTLSGAAVSGQSGNVTATLPAGSLSVQITLAVVNDALQEGDESLGLRLSGGTGYTLADADAALVTLTDNDHHLTLATAGTGGGSLGGSPAGAYNAGDAIALTATPDADSQFAGWSAGCGASFAMPAADLTCTATFNLAPGILVSPMVGLSTSEAGESATFTVVLRSPPTVDVTLGLSSSDEDEGVVSPAFLTFTPADWNQPRTVTVTGVDDGVPDGTASYAVTFTPAVSGDPGYHGLQPGDVSLTNAAGGVVRSFTGPTATGSGQATLTIAGGGDTCGLVLAESAFVPASGLQRPAGWNFPHGAVTFKAVGCDQGSILTVTLDLPGQLNGGNAWKLDPALAPRLLSAAQIVGRRITYTVQDGGGFDADGTVNGEIVDPAGFGTQASGQGAAPIPTLGAPALAWLALLLAAIAGRSGGVRRRG